MAERYTALIEAYEDRHYPVPHVAPENLLRALMDRRELSQSQIAHLLGGSGHTSEVLSGKRSIGKAQAKRLAAFSMCRQIPSSEAEAEWAESYP